MAASCCRDKHWEKVLLQMEGKTFTLVVKFIARILGIIKRGEGRGKETCNIVDHKVLKDLVNFGPSGKYNYI